METWSATARNALLPGRDFSANVVVFVDSNKKGSKIRYQEELEAFNPSAITVTARPQFLWLDVDIMATVMEACGSKVKAVRYPPVPIKDFTKSTKIQSSLRSLTSVDVVLPAGKASFERITILLKTLFHQAVVSSTLADHSGDLLTIKGLTGIQLGLMLAKVKVFSKLFHDIAMHDFHEALNAVDCDTMRSLQASVLSAQAILGRGTHSHAQGALFEATPDTLISRPLGESYQSTNTISLMGCFKSADVPTLRHLLEMCVHPSVEERPAYSPADIRTDFHKVAAQRMFEHLPVPNGWWYDGTSYIDVHGSRLSNRPDLDTLLDLYLVEKNKEVDMFNKLLREVMPFIQNEN